MNLTKSMTLVLLGFLSSLATAETPQEAAVKKLIESRLVEGAKAESVTKTPYLGLYEVRIGGSLIYTDEKAQYFIDGHVIDAKTRKDLTQARMDDLNKVKFSDLPMESAIKTVKGNGKRVIAIFEDPNCGYCKRFRQTTLKEVDDITIYTFMYNILSEDSVAKSKNIWCSADRNKALDDWMVNGKAAPAAAADCKTPHEKTMALGKKLNINGTPAIIFTDGSRIPGAVDIKQLEAKLTSLK